MAAAVAAAVGQAGGDGGGSMGEQFLMALASPDREAFAGFCEILWKACR